MIDLLTDVCMYGVLGFWGYPTYISTNISEMTYSYNSATRRLDITCTGSGSIFWNLTNMNEMADSQGFWTFEYNGAIIGRYKDNQFRSLACSTYSFYPSATSGSYIHSDLIEGLPITGTFISRFISNLAPGVGMIVLIITIGTALGLLVFGVSAFIKNNIKK